MRLQRLAGPRSLLSLSFSTPFFFLPFPLSLPLSVCLTCLLFFLFFHFPVLMPLLSLSLLLLLLQVIFYQDRIMSFVQTRGSVPVFWSQPGVNVSQTKHNHHISLYSIVARSLSSFCSVFLILILSLSPSFILSLFLHF